WRFGAAMCKITPFVQGVVVCASVNTLGAIALDRYLAICFTMEYTITRRIAKFIILWIWVFSVCLMTPWAIFYRQTTYSKTPVQTLFICTQHWPEQYQERHYFLGAIFLGCYAIPLVLIAAFYTLIAIRVWTRDAPGISKCSGIIYESKMKVLKMLFAVVLVFTLSWLPLYTIQLYFYYGETMPPALKHTMHTIVFPIVQWLGSSNTSVNPIIYCMYSKKYRKGFKKVMKLYCLKKNNHETHDSPIFNYSSTHINHRVLNRTTIKRVSTMKTCSFKRFSTFKKNGEANAKPEHV
ncbi:unnamed protein product, partial [Owenia fusiformis]